MTNRSCTETAIPLGSPWYRVQKYGIEIKEVTVTRSTSSSVWYMDTDWHGKRVERKAKKMTEFYKYLPTRKEAEDNIRERAKGKIEYCERELEGLRAEYAKVCELYGAA